MRFLPLKLLSTLFFIAVFANTECAADWAIDKGQSKISFISIKQNEIAEVHSFKDFTGTVSREGKVNITIALNSVETNIDIRNERMKKFLFETLTAPDAVLNADIDIKSMQSMKVGERRQENIAFSLSLHKVKAEIDTDIFLTRIAENKVLVETENPILIHADDFNMGAGVEKLRELAKLDTISPAVPVSVSLIFTQ